MPRRLSQRQQQLLTAVIDAYVKTCSPVGSRLIAQQSTLEVSPATIRNDMVELEAGGYLTHPHTSAGRVPTDTGYQYYVDHALAEHRLSPMERETLAAPPEGEPRVSVKAVAKILAELSAGCVVVGFSAHDVFYTGIANLFSQPEFRDYQFSYLMSEVIDHLDEVMAQLYDRTVSTPGVQILIGQRNPFGERCSTLLAAFGQRPEPDGVVGILGPLRMNYSRNRALLERACQVGVR